MDKTNLMIFYENCPNKYKFARLVAFKTGVSVNGVLNWCKGYCKTVDEYKLAVLSEETGIPKDELFNLKEAKDVQP